MRLAALVTILLAFAVPALAASPEEAYWAVRQHAIKRLGYKGDEKPNDQAYHDVETAALADMDRRIIDIVGPVKVEGFSNKPKSHVVALSTSPDYGQLDGVKFVANGNRVERFFWSRHRRCCGVGSRIGLRTGWRILPRGRPRHGQEQS